MRKSRVRRATIALAIFAALGTSAGVASAQEPADAAAPSAAPAPPPADPAAGVAPAGVAPAEPAAEQPADARAREQLAAEPAREQPEDESTGAEPASASTAAAPVPEAAPPAAPSASEPRAGRAARRSHAQTRRHGGRLATAQTSPDRRELPCTISGDDGPNQLIGTEGDDVICGGGGNDSISGLGGSDVLRGGPGDDTIDAGPGDDTINGDGAEERPLPPPGTDQITCGEGTDSYVPDSLDQVAADCEEPIAFAMPSGSIQERVVEETPVSREGRLGPADAPVRAGGFIDVLLTERSRGPVSVPEPERELTVEGDTIRVVLECSIGSLDRDGRLTLVSTGRDRAELAKARFTCDRLGRITVELPVSSKLERLLEDGDPVRARLVIRMPGHTIRTDVEISGSAQ